MASSNNGPLSAGSHGSFPISGSLNMLDLAKLPVQASVGVLSRYAAGRVNPYTVLVSEALCNSFQLTAQGRAKIRTAVDKLKVVGTVGAALEFGFGIEDLVRSMVKSEQGTVVLVLCAALREVYSIDISTEVLLEMARFSQVGEKWMPSSLEWKAMLDACSGVLAETPFGHRAETLMRLGNDGQRLGAVQRLEASPGDLRTCSSPKSIAEALFTMAAVSRGEIESITLVGGPDTGWLAAVAEWILDMKISISNFDEEIIYTNTNDPEAVRIRILSGRRAPKSQDIVVQGRMYILKEISEILGHETTTSILTTVSGRVEWKTALRTAFLHDFKRMVDSLPSTLGALLGSAARLYKGVVQADKSFPLAYRTACTSYCDGSYGSGYVGNVLAWFPELKKLKEHMEKAVAKSLEAAKRDYEASISRLRQDCACLACQAPTNGFEPDADLEMTPASASDDSEDGHIAESTGSDIDDWDPDKYCAVIMAETIIVLARTLANVSLSNPEILPMRSGFELAYARQLMMRRSARSGRSALRELGQFAFCMDFDANFSFGARDNDYGTGIRLDHVLELFTGEQIHPTSDKGTSAACNRGLCAYFQILDGDSFTKSNIAHIGVIPGRIQYHQKSYKTLEDRKIEENKGLETMITDLACDGDAFPTLELSVKESSTALECLIRLPRLSEPAGAVAVGPANLADFIAARHGLVQCSLKNGSRKKCLKMSGLTTEERKRLKTEGGHIVKDWMRSEAGVWFIHVKSPLAARVTLSYCAPQYSHRSSIFLVDGECMDCCLRIATSIERTEGLYFLCL